MKEHVHFHVHGGKRHAHAHTHGPVELRPWRDVMRNVTFIGEGRGRDAHPHSARREPDA